MAKVDYTLRKQQISGRYFFTDFNQPAVVPRTTCWPQQARGNAVRLQNVSVIHNYTASPDVLFNSTFGLEPAAGRIPLERAVRLSRCRCEDCRRRDSALEGSSGAKHVR